MPLLQIRQQPPDVPRIEPTNDGKAAPSGALARPVANCRPDSARSPGDELFVACVARSVEELPQVVDARCHASSVALEFGAIFAPWDRHPDGRKPLAGSVARSAIEPGARRAGARSHIH